ncbi:MAG: M61 family metallopeptidase [Gemmatimonadaceae bacterium]
MSARILPTLLLVAACATRSAAPARALDIAYRVAMPEPASHLYEVQLDVGGLARGEAVSLQLPVWSPGRYARMDFARNVQAFRAESPEGQALAWTKSGGSTWRVGPTTGDRLRVRYRVFANDLSGTFSVLDTAHANWNGAALFMYVEGYKPNQVRLTIAPPAGWRVMNGYVGTALNPRPNEFTFPTYDHMIDAPTEVSANFVVDSFTVHGVLYRVMTHANGGEASMRGQRARFVGDVEKVVRYQNGVIAPPPIPSYTFLVHLGYGGGDGMEHLTSTQVITSGTWTDTATVLPALNTASHEFFHVWNVKRIRPAALGPFDYTDVVHQPSLWVAEGWTNYYGNASLHRAGIVSREAFYAMMAGRARSVSETPARKERSARQASFDAPFFDGAATPMRTNAANTFLTYYWKGEALAWLLDLEIRGRTGNRRSLDDALRLLKERTWDAPRASYYLQGRGYTEQDVERAVSDAAGADLHPWFERYVGGVEDLPWNETLARAGLRLAIAGEGPSPAYRLAEAPDATPEQLRVREGWLRGTTTP